MQDLNDLFYYSRVVEHGGFAAAGRALRMPRSRLSRRIQLLEQRLGVVLIQRSTRRFAVTDIGHEYYLHCRAVLVEAQAAQEAVERTRSEPRGLVRLTCAVGLLHFRVAEMLGRFMAECPEVHIELESTNRRVDVVGEGVDLALVVRRPPLGDTALIMKPLSASPQCLVASPALLAIRPPPAVPEDLADWPALDRGKAEDGHAWRLTGPDGEVVIAQQRTRLVTGDMTALHHAALAGVGLAQLPLLTVRDDLRAGRLVRVLPEWTLTPAIVYAAFSSRRGMLPSVRSLIDFLTAEFAAADRGAARDPRRSVRHDMDGPSPVVP